MNLVLAASLKAFSSDFTSAYCFSSWSRFNPISLSKNSSAILALATLTDTSALASDKECYQDLKDMLPVRDLVFDVWLDVTLVSET